MAEAETASLNSSTAAGLPRSARWILSGVGVVAVFLGLLTWVISSPVGGSPDDDYHLGSIWCPMPFDTSGCEYEEFETAEGPTVSVVVPETLTGGKACMAFDSEIDASCADGLSDDRWVPSERVNIGNYPGGFYTFHNMFVGEDVQFSVLVMRTVNVLIALAGLVLVGALARPEQRHHLLVATIVAFVPMGVYFVASNNPSSWTISGCLIYAAALIASADAFRWRRWALLALAALGIILAATSRTDGSFYIIVISLAMWFLVPLTRDRIPTFALSAISSLILIAKFATSQQAETMTGSGGWPTSDSWERSDIFLNNLLTLPDHIGSFWGLYWGPGWFDVPLKGWSTLTMIFAAGGLVFVGARELWSRKVLSSAIAAGALLGIPVVALTLRQVQPVYYYQGRYMLPLLGVFFFIWLARRPGLAFYRRTGELVALLGLVAVANMMALHSVIVRYTVGTDAGILIRIGEPEWWPWSIPPTTMWALGSLAMAGGLAALLLVTSRWLPHSDAERSAGPSRRAG